MKKYLLVSLTFILLLNSIYLIFSNQNLIKSSANLTIKVDSLSKKVEEIDSESKKEEDSSLKSLNDKLSRVNKYAIEIRQIGGAGSRTTNATIWNLEDQEYFSEKEGWALYSFNSPADLLYVSCRDGYTASICVYNEKKFNPDNDMHACVFPMIYKAIQNTIYTECIKS